MGNVMGVAGHGVRLRVGMTGLRLSFRLGSGHYFELGVLVIVKSEVGNTGGHAWGIAASLEGEGVPARGFIKAEEGHMPINRRLFQVFSPNIGGVLRAIDLLEHEPLLVKVVL